MTGRGRSGGSGNNLFRGLLVDLHDGSPMYQSTKPRRRYISSWAAQQGKPGACALSFRYEVFEKSLPGCCRELDPRLLQPSTPLDQDVAQCRDALGQLAV